MKKLLAYSISTLIVLLFLELILRWFGPGVFEIEHYQIESNPSSAMLAHPYRAFGLNPGSYSIKVNNKLEFKAVHNNDSHRITSINPIMAPAKTVGLFGCSFTYGWGLENEETFAFLLQKEMPKTQIVNMAVPGFGTLQALQQLQNAEKLNRPIPDMVVLVYGSFHDHRNTLTWQQRRMWASIISGGLQNEELGAMQFPFVKNKTSLKIEYEKGINLYQPWFLSPYLALSNFLEIKIESFIDKTKGIEDVSLAIIQEINALCKVHKSKLIVAGVLDNEKTKTMLSRLEGLNISCVDISVDTLNPLYNLSPLDDHPNQLANQAYAHKLFKFLSGINLQKFQD